MVHKNIRRLCRDARRVYNLNSKQELSTRVTMKSDDIHLVNVTKIRGNGFPKQMTHSIGNCMVKQCSFPVKHIIQIATCVESRVS